MEAWFDRFPGRLEWELEQFAERNLDFRLDEEERRVNRRVLLRGAVAHAGDHLELEVLYPDLFPYIRPEVFAPGVQLDRHQNPFDHNLCLLDRSTRAWSPSNSGAWLVGERVPLLLNLVAVGGEELRLGEAPQGEPITAYFPPEPGTAVFVPAEALAVPDGERAGSGHLWFPPDSPPAVRVRGLIGELAVKGRRRKMQVRAKASGKLATRFGGERLSFRWVRVDRPPLDRSPQALLAAAESVEGGFGSPPWQRVAGGQVAVTGLVFREEVAQGDWQDAWLFAVKVRQPTTAAVHETAYCTRGERLTVEDLASRLPVRARLSQARIAIIGTGALGAPIALECARAQARELRLLDHDHVEVGNTVRWPYGLSTVSHLKVDVLAQMIVADYPFTEVTPVRHQLGGSALARQHRTESEFDMLEHLLDGAALAIDATAEIGLQQLTAALCDERQLPQLYVSATEGARGGIVARVIPGVTGCWQCLQLGLDEGSIQTPAHDDVATVQPRGCASRTFTGANFDLAPVVAQAVRAATATINMARQGDRGPDVFICSLPDDGLSAPYWLEAHLEQRADCPACSGVWCAAESG